MPERQGHHPSGATSCYVGDNTDVLVMKEGLALVQKKLVGVMALLAKFADEYRDMPAWPTPICSPPSSPPWASAPACG